MNHVEGGKQSKPWTVLMIGVELCVLNVDYCYECIVKVKLNDSS